MRDYEVFNPETGKQICFLKRFSKRMLFLALITGVVIAVSMPLTFFVLTWKDVDEKAYKHLVDTRYRVTDVIKKNPSFWQYNTAGLEELLGSSLVNAGVSSVAIYNNYNATVYRQEFSKAFFADIRKQADLVYNNNRVGYVEIYERTSSEVLSTAVLAISFSILGLLVGIVLYRFPTSIVKNAEKQMEQAFGKLSEINCELKKTKGHLEEMVIRDSKTGLFNATYSFTRLKEEMDTAAKTGGCVSIMMLDIDYFKKYNDRYGHLKGDNVLIAIAGILKTSIRDMDIAGRYGGEEFIIIFPNAGEEKAYSIGQRLRAGVEAAEFEGEETQPLGKITISIGISTYSGGEMTSQQLIEKADKALYRAKEAGRNTVCQG